MFCSGCISETTYCEIDRTRARPAASAGSSGLLGHVSSRYSLLAVRAPSGLFQGTTRLVATCQGRAHDGN